jgi:ADP-ribose pyrophosphatase YjhB (NUDIX family)
MELITEIYEHAVHPELVRKEDVLYKIRKAARALLFRGDKLAMLFVSKHNYHKLPGGGIDAGETIHEALTRELLEETGWNSRVTDDLGVTIEYRDKIEQLQISYAYVAEAIGSPQEIHLTEKEQSEGFSLVWMDIHDVLRVMKLQDTPESYSGVFIQKRDLAILEFYLQKRS